MSGVFWRAFKVFLLVAVAQHVNWAIASTTLGEKAFHYLFASSLASIFCGIKWSK